MDAKARRVHRDMIPPGLSDLPLPRDDTEESVPGGDVHQRAVAEAFGALSCYASSLGGQQGPTWYVSSQVLIATRLWGLVWRHRPDIFVVPGVKSVDRSTYDTATDGPVPAFVLEVADARTWDNDVFIRPGWYDVLGVHEYAVFDPTETHLGTSLRAWKVGSDGWAEWSPVSDAGGKWVWLSTVLGLALRPEGTLLRFDHPEHGPLLTRAELTRALDEERRRRTALEAELRHLRGG